MTHIPGNKIESATEIINKLNTGVYTMDELLQPPGKWLHEIPIDDLTVNVIPSGFPSCDNLMLLKKDRAELIVIGGRPSIGKSAWAFQLALQAATHTTVQIFSVEMDARSILTRLIASQMGIRVEDIQKGRVSHEKLLASRELFRKYRYRIDDRPGLSINDIVSSSKSAKRHFNTGLICIDYLQLVASEKGHSRESEVSAMSRTLKSLGKELNIPIILLSQLNRLCETRSKTGKPQMSDLRDSGSIEADADVIILLNREEVYTGERKGEADVIIAKNRNGKTGTIVMGFDAEKTLFIDRDAI